MALDGNTNKYVCELYPVLDVTKTYAWDKSGSIVLLNNSHAFISICLDDVFLNKAVCAHPACMILVYAIAVFYLQRWTCAPEG